MISSRPWAGLFLALSVLSCSTLPSVHLPPELGGRWLYVGGEPADDRLLSWEDWPDVAVEIDTRGRWVVTPRTAGTRTVLPPVSRVIAVDGNVLTLVRESGGSPFQIYWRLQDGRLQFWWGDHADWLKPHVTYRRP